MSDRPAVASEFDPRTKLMRGTAYRDGRADQPIDFVCPFITQIDESLWMGGCANGLMLPVEIEHLVSLYPWESYDQHPDGELASMLVLRMYDSAKQGFEQVRPLARWVNVCRAQGPTLVHCQAGLNRSGLVCATALILAGVKPKLAIETLRELRSPAVLANGSFERWLLAGARSSA